MKTVYYFGDRYYAKSGTMMGELYDEKGHRYDWGFLRRDVKNGEEIVVKEATPAMIAWAEEKLKAYQ